MADHKRIEDEIESMIEVLRGARSDVGRASDGELASVVGACGRVRSWVAAIESSCVSEVRRRKGDAAALLAAEQRASRRRAAAAVNRSKLIDKLPSVGDALASGEITADHADAFASVATAHDEALAADAASLLAHASKVGADQLRDRLRRWQNEQDRRKGQSQLERQRSNRRGSISTRADDGMGIFHFELDSLAAARVRAASPRRLKLSGDSTTVDRQLSDEPPLNESPTHSRRSSAAPAMGLPLIPRS